MTRTVTRNLNKIIDVNYYPVETAKKSNMRHRPIGLGTQGLADAFLLLGMAFDSPEVSRGQGGGEEDGNGRDCCRIWPVTGPEVEAAAG